MSIKFQPRESSSFDPSSGIWMSEPRILPATLRNGEEGTEYQYSFFRGDQRIGGLGFNGPDFISEADGKREWVFIMDLGKEQTIRSMLSYKADFRDDGDNLSYLRQLAEGLVLAYAGRDDNEDNLRYVATTTSAALEAAGVQGADGEADGNGVIVLAEIAIPARRKRG